MRQIALDTETTGLEVRLGHRVIELAGVEILNRRTTNRHFHVYLNPDRDIDEGALQVHGIRLEFLQDKPRFPDVAAEFLDFVQGAELVIHNAAFDLGFLDAELERCKKGSLRSHVAGVIDTLALAKELHPGKRNNLDTLCERYFVDNSNRTLHGALLDAELLADVYLAMTRGQESLVMDMTPAPRPGQTARSRSDRPRLPVLRANAAELAEHEQVLADIDKASGGKCLWKALSSSAA